MSANSSRPNAFLKLAFTSDSCDADDLPQCEAQRVNVSAADILPLLMDAAQSNRVWLEDFYDESIEISQEFYEVLLAYRRLVFSPTSRAA
jgi:hypothetical protein